MASFSSILVDVDSSATSHPALEQAFDLAERCSATVKVVEVLPELPRHARKLITLALEDEVSNRRRERLQALAEDVKGISVSTAFLRGRPADVLTKEVLSSGHDLLLRSHRRDLQKPARPFGPVDMELLRVCPCPVWLVTGRRRAHLRTILAAVNTDPAEAVEQQLNGMIVELALLLKRLEGAELTLLQVWDVYGDELLKSHMSEENLAELVRIAQQTASDDFTSFCDVFGDRLAGVKTELVQGDPAGVIPSLAESRGIDLVVMGTVARTGVAGLLIGNTAERVLQRLGGSVLAVKPSSFVSPVVAE